MKILYVEHYGDNLYMLKTCLEQSGDFEAGVQVGRDRTPGRNSDCTTSADGGS
jgi:hypothetical protein